MRLQDDIDFTTLTWVKQELDDTLKQAQQALEAYVEDTADKSQMRFCASYLHQVQGTLRMVELYGAAMVVEEMERLALGLLDGQVKQADDSYTVLMRGMVQLPDYLERLQSGHRDIPIVLLPLLNDLRACRGEKLLSETSLFSPDLGAVLPASAAGAKSVVAQAMIASNGGRLRLAYQFGLLKWFKGDDVDGNLTRLIAIVDRVRSMCVQIDARRLFWIAAAALEAVLVKGVDASVALKLLAGRVDRELKRLIDAGEASFAAAPPTDLVKGLLYYVAQSKASSERIADLRQVYKLDRLMPSEAELEHARGALSGHNRALLDTVGTAIKEDLLRVKDALDLYLRTGSANVDDLAPQGEALHRVADTLGMLGLGVPRRVVLDQQDVLERIVRGRQPAEESVLLDIAGSLLYVESSLDDHIERLGADNRAAPAPTGGFELPPAEVRKILDATTKEASANIQQAKQDIVAFIESPWDHSKIEQIPRLLEEIAGAMRMLNLPEPAELLGGVIRFAEVELLQHRRVPSGDQLDLMADAIASIEFYLEAVKEGRRNRDKILDVTRRSLEALGYWPLPAEGGESEAAEAPVAAVPAPSAPEAPSLSIPDYPTFADTFTTERTQPPAAIEVEQEAAPVTAPISDAGAVEALIASFAQTEDTTPVIDGLGTSEVLPEIEMSNVVQIAPGEGLEGLVVGESAAEPLAPSVQDLAGLRISADTDAAPEVLEALEPLLPPVESDAESATFEVPVLPVDEGSEPAVAAGEPDFAESLDVVDALPEPVAEAVVVAEPEPAVELTPPPVAKLAPVVAPPMMTPSIQLPDVGFHSVPSDEIDDEIREVFVEEVQDELDNLNRQYPAWKHDLGDLEKLKPVRRSFHTLKGSGRLVGALAIGEYAWKIENMLNRVLDKTIQPTPAVLDLLDHAIAALPGMLSALKGEGQPDANVGTIMWVSDQLATGQEVWLPKSSPAPVDTADYQPAAVAGAVAVEVEAVPEAPESTQATVVAGVEEISNVDHVSADEIAPDIDATQSEAIAQTEVAENAGDSAADAGGEGNASLLDVDPMLMEILSSEVDAHLSTIRGYLDATEAAGPIPVTEELLRAVHTLNGALSMVDLPVLTRVVAPLEGYLKRLRARGMEPTTEGLESLHEAAACIATVMLALESRAPAPDTAELADRVLALRDGLPAPDHPFHGFGIQVIDEAKDDDIGHTPADDEVEPGIEEAHAASEPRPWYEAEEEGETTVELTELFDAADDFGQELEAKVSPEEGVSPLPDLDHEFAALSDETADLEILRHSEMEVSADGAGTAEQHFDADFAPRSNDAVVLEPEPTAADENVLAHAIDLSDLLGIPEESVESSTQAQPVADEFETAVALSGVEPSIDLDSVQQSEIVDDVATASLDPDFAELAPASVLTTEDVGAEQSVDLSELWSSELEDDVSLEPKVESVDASDQPDFVAETETETEAEAEAEIEAEAETAAEAETEAEANTEPTVEWSAGLAADIDGAADEAGAPLFGQVSEEQDAEPATPAEVRADNDGEPSFESVLVDQTETLESAIDLSLLDFDAAASDFEPDGGLAEVPTFAAVADAVADAPEITAEAAYDTAESSAEPSVEIGYRSEVLTPQVAAVDVAEPASRGPVDIDPTGPLDLPDMDLDLLDIFVEEGVDILDHADGMMARLREAPDDREPVASLQRDLHTLKGGARMAGLYPIGDLSHAMESLFEAIVHGERAASRPAIEALEKAFDRLHGMVQRVRGRQAIALPEHTIARIEAILEGREDEWLASHSDEASASPEPVIQVETAHQPDAIAELPQTDVDAVADEAAPAQVRRIIPARPSSRTGVQRRTQLDDDEVAARAAQQELIRVRADLLDNLVNFAGEVSIYRSRLEAQMGGFRFNLVEFEQTVLRLREQLRKLEMETEAQILSRFQRESEQSGNTEFDPLELDRFSTLQQLSRALAESVSDLVSIQNLLDDIARQSETLLLQQSRVSSDLQEGLMRTRMVPFESLVPRLRRILRQTAAELGKKAQLKVEGTQGEMDRTVLERMTAPFEHMLRNSLAHGIESPEIRQLRGKSEEGTVSIRVSREATEVLIQVTDDGGGMNRDAIRRKAIERGLMTAEAQLSDRDIFQFVLEAGFSTASEVSKVSGRGVGMDVVASEVKQLGGTLELDSDAEQGTRITIRLPFTLAVAQAVMVKLGEATYAIPMSSITGVTRMPRKELDRRLEQRQLEIVYGGETYQIYDLGDLLRSPVGHGIDETQVPLLMSKTGDQRAAVRVTQVVGSKEVVVKSAGLQLSIVPGIFGATIMGDGRVVVILDLAPLVRHGVALRQAPELAAELELLEPLPEPAVRRQPLVMVVDDSITMRKVTTRVLERSNFDVFTAKDGLDAVEQLQDRMPDVILLDIEMPRMDGYEVATYIRNDQRLKHIPIIMITSRTGEKHRQRALEVGVDRYLGKPYQENDLLKNVQEALTAGHANVH